MVSRAAAAAVVLTLARAVRQSTRRRLGVMPPPTLCRMSDLQRRPAPSNDWRDMKRGTPDHPKMHALAAALGIPWPYAVGLLECLWHWTAQYAQDGFLGRYPDAAILLALKWDPGCGDLIKALSVCGWLDRCSCHGLRVHDWDKHADQGVKRALDNKKSSFLICYGDASRILAGDAIPDSLPLPLPLTLPLTLTLPLPLPLPLPVANAATTAEGERRDSVANRPHNPLFDRRKLTEETNDLVDFIATAENLDPTEVARKVTDYKGKGYVRLDVLSEDRFAHAAIKLRQWARQLRGDVEPGPQAEVSGDPAVLAFQEAMAGRPLHD